ncbi:protein of unknown function [Peptoclostridium litorale DSM 5388]|uniref:Ferredoxin n=1 Tax=Peptoclostridium litorale DSM 5388 TaxID=1121324 RepID=A0A069RQ62_PEPLI|nr:DUF4332 domain-containing protein [Peptoclostridium litorale]KDR96317.1 ferredoxin [Peptoclostridium litorale DSM 5388]SIO26264.1 protein of unknown function [Peptoclostridium litorale DSM 5388]
MTKLSVMSRLSTIESMNSDDERKLNEAGIHSTSELFERCTSKASRKSLAKETGIPEHFMLRWATVLDLERIKGVGMEYAELLEACGVDTVPALARRNPEHLFEKIVEVNAKISLVKKLPTQKQVADWVEQAKELPRMISY